MTSPVVHQLVYTSVSAYDFEQEDLLSILQVAQKRNGALGITGILGHMPETGEIIQLLEGSEASIRAVFESIRRDPRHVAVAVHYEGDCAERLFADWHMCFAGNEAWRALDRYRARGKVIHLRGEGPPNPALRLLREHVSSFL